jgi:hypothetical protein
VSAGTDGVIVWAVHWVPVGASGGLLVAA